MKINSNVDSKSWLMADIAILLFMTALAYAPFAGRCGFYNDSWWLAWTAHIGGHSGLIGAMSSDRPVAGYGYALLYSIFGLQPLYWQIALIVNNYLGAICFLWCLRLVWSKQRLATLGAAILFVLYPGFSQRQDPLYWQQMSALTFIVFSFAASLRALTIQDITKKIFLNMLAMMAACLSYAINEMFLVLELLRVGLFCVYFFGKQNKPNTTQYLKEIAYQYLPYVMTSTGYLAWRLFIFSNPRHGSNIGRWFGSPQNDLSRWLSKRIWDIFEDTMDAGLIAWVFPVLKKLFSSDHQTILAAFLAGLLGAAIWWFYSAKVGDGEATVHPKQRLPLKGWLGLGILLVSLVSCVVLPSYRLRAVALSYPTSELIIFIGVIIYLSCQTWVMRSHSMLPSFSGFWRNEYWPFHWLTLGFLGIVCGILLTIMTGRSLVLADFRDRWTTSSIPGAAMFIVGLVGLIGPRWIQRTLIAGAIGVTLVFHICNGQEWSHGWEHQKQFIWQLYWRAPRLAPNSLLVGDVGNWPLRPRRFDFWGLLGLTYGGPLSEQVGGIPIDQFEGYIKLLDNHEKIPQEGRPYEFFADSNLTIVASMPSSKTCLYVHDGVNFVSLPESHPKLGKAWRYSNLSAISEQPISNGPSAQVFGQPPSCDWCYYYQKAELARQFQHWETIVDLYRQTQRLGLKPKSPRELSPFIDGLTRTGNLEEAQSLAKKMHP